MPSDIDFTISRGFSFYNVIVSNDKLKVVPAPLQRLQTQSPSIAQSLQLIAMSHMLTTHRTDYGQFFIEHFESKGWTVEDIRK